MALLSKPAADGAGFSLYLTPDSLPHARALVLAYSASPGAAPEGPGLRVHVGDAALALGCAKEF